MMRAPGPSILLAGVLVVATVVATVAATAGLALAASVSDSQALQDDPSSGNSSDSSAWEPGPVPAAVSPLESPVRLDLTPRGVPTPPPTFPDPERVSSALAPSARIGDHDLDFWARYNRVEGPAAHAALVRRLHRTSYLPAYRLQFGFAFSADRGLYRVAFEQPVAPKNKITVGAEGYRSYVPFWYADESISSGENSASAFFLHRDYWDWYEAEGLRGFVGVRPSPYVQLTLAVLQEDETALTNQTDWSVFDQTADFPVNPSIPEGEYRGVEAALHLDTRPRDEDGEFRPRGAWSSLEHWHRVAWERGDGGLGGDFDQWRFTADLRNYLRLTPNQVISTRLLAGVGDSKDGLLPAGRRFEVGGLGTLRGHLYRSLDGDHVALANLQYAFGVGRRGWLLFFADAGTAWDDGSLIDQRIPVDVGTGFRIGHSGPTLLVSRTLEDGADFRAEFRFQESY